MSTRQTLLYALSLPKRRWTRTEIAMVLGPIVLGILYAIGFGSILLSLLIQK